jgi:hypothetical protein
MYELSLPSGLTVEANDLDGPAVIKIAERVGANATGQTIAAFMECTAGRVLDPGPYPHLKEGEKVPKWESVLWGDLFTAIVKLRIASFPDKPHFDFEFSCPYCRALQPSSISLVDYVNDPDHFQSLPEESKLVLQASKLFETKLPGSGRRVWFDLARADQDEPMRREMAKEQRVKETDIEAIAKRVKEIEGVEGKSGPTKDLRGLWRWLRAPGNMKSRDIDHLLAEMRDADIVVDSQVLAWCSNHAGNCVRQSRVTLPLNTSFFRPRSGTKKARTVSVED